jgi:hypothetical protein
MLASAAALTLTTAAGVTLWLKGRRDHREALSLRAALLDGVLPMFPGAATRLGGDGYPRLIGGMPDGRPVEIDVVADTLVTRRLPQLWLKLTLADPEPRRSFSIGALARSTGAEFYSLVHGLPEWIAPPAGELPLLVRGKAVRPEHVAAAERAFRTIFADPLVKEAVASPRGVRIIRQAAEGDRASHLLLRQARFVDAAISPEAVEKALADAATLASALSEPAPAGAEA